MSFSLETEKLVFGKGSAFSQTEFINNRRGQKLFATYWYPSRGIQPKALAFISHGFSEHLGNYHSVGEALASVNVLAFGHDHIGHGQSDGKAAYIEDVDDYVYDLIHHCQLIRQRYCASLPIFLVSHSMGSMICLRAAICYPKIFTGMVLQGPLIIPGPQIGPVDFRITSPRAALARSVLGVMSWFSPELILGNVNMDLISRDEEVQKALATDQLRWLNGCKVRMLQAFVDCLEDNMNLMPSLKVPFLSLHGTADGLCNVNGSRLLQNCSFVDDKTFKEYEGAAHNLWLEIPEVRQSALHETVKWITDRC